MIRTFTFSSTKYSAISHDIQHVRGDSLFFELQVFEISVTDQIDQYARQWDVIRDVPVDEILKTPIDLTDIDTIEFALKTLQDDNPTKATLVTGAEVSNNAILFTAVDYGVGGNSTFIQLKDPEDVSKALSIGVANNTIFVNLATDSSGSITSTATSIIDAVNNDVAASALVVSNYGTSTGSAVVSGTAAQQMSGGGGSLPLIAKDLTNGIIVTDAVNGMFVLRLQPADTASLDIFEYVYSIRATFTDGESITPILGKFDLIPGVA